MKDEIKELIENRDTKQQEIYNHAKQNPKEWFEFLNDQNIWLSLYCDFIKDVNRIHIIIIENDLYLICYDEQYYNVHRYHCYNFNYTYTHKFDNYKQYVDYHNGFYKTRTEEILYFKKDYPPFHFTCMRP
jgi:hypothetical protein